MLIYNYTARDPKTGKKVQSVVQAENERAAAKLLTNQGLAPLDIKLKQDHDDFIARRRNRVKTKDKILFSRQLSTLINAGLPLIQSLRNVSNQTQSRSLKAVIVQIIGDVEGGKSLTDALKQHPKVFNNVFISLVGAGEASGTLDTSLDRLATQQEKDAEILGKVRGAMVYPIVVLCVMAAVVAFMMIKVLPSVQVLYDSFSEATLPLPTQILLAMSVYVRKGWWIVLLAIGFLAFVANRWVHTPGGRRVLDRLKMRAWPIGPLFMKLYMARFGRTATTLVASGVPLIQMLEITGDSIDNVHVEGSLIKATEAVKGGKSLADALKDDENFLPLVPDMLKIGEQSGSMEQMLAKTADYYEKEVENQIRTISTIIEPFLMIVLGVFALLIVIAILLPIYGLAGQGALG